MLLEELLKLEKKNELVSIDRDCHDEELTGFLSSVSENIIAMHLITNDGEYDGFTIFETDQITEVYWGNREHKAIASLILANEIPQFIEYENTEFQDLIIEFSQKYSSICLHCHGDEDKFDVAEVEAFDDDWLKIHTYGVKKSLSRMKKIISRTCISRIVVNSPYQTKIVALHDKKL